MGDSAAPLRKAPGPAPSNVEVAAQALREAVVSGWLGPGERIKETPLAAQLGLSRGPIREAIRLLEHDGLLRIIPNRGAVVPVPTSLDVLEVYAMRASLGSLALHKLMLGGDPPPLPVLDRQLTRLERAVNRAKSSDAAAADLDYQSAMVAGANMPRVTRQFDQLTWQVRIFITMMDIRYDDKLPEMFREVTDLHQAILDREPGRVEELWRDKMERWVRDFVAQMAEGFDAELWVALTGGLSPRANGTGAVAS